MRDIFLTMFHVLEMWELSGNYAGTMRELCGNYAGTMRELCGNLMFLFDECLMFWKCDCSTPHPISPSSFQNAKHSKVIIFGFNRPQATSLSISNNVKHSPKKKPEYQVRNKLWNFFFTMRDAARCANSRNGATNSFSCQ